MELLKKILDDVNIGIAYKRVVKNGGSKGVDGVTTAQLQDYMQEHWATVKQKIIEGHYVPNMVRGVEIPKPKGGKRLLGIPSVIDRLIQQAIHQAIFQAQSYINQGYQFIIDLDLKSFFDLENQDYLMSLLHRKINDKLLLKLIRRYLQSITTTRKGNAARQPFKSLAIKYYPE